MQEAWIMIAEDIIASSLDYNFGQHCEKSESSTPK